MNTRICCKVENRCAYILSAVDLTWCNITISQTLYTLTPPSLCSCWLEWSFTFSFLPLSKTDSFFWDQHNSYLLCGSLHLSGRNNCYVSVFCAEALFSFLLYLIYIMSQLFSYTSISPTKTELLKSKE